MMEDFNKTTMKCPYHNLQYQFINSNNEFVCIFCFNGTSKLKPIKIVQEQNKNVITQNELKYNQVTQSLNKLALSLFSYKETFEKCHCQIKSMIEKTNQLISIIENILKKLKKNFQFLQKANNQQQCQKQIEIESNIQNNSLLQQEKLKFNQQIIQLQLFPQKNEQEETNMNQIQKQIQVTQLNKQTDLKSIIQKIKQEVTQNQFIPNQNGQINAILYKNEIFYIKYIMSNNQVLGKLYKTNFDINSNPRFLIQEGRFETEISQGRVNFFLNDDEGIEYEGKSKVIKYQGKFINGRYSQTPAVSKSKKIIIQDINSNKLINSSYNKDNIKNQKSNEVQEWLKYNHRITQRDLQILDIKQQKWVTSNILDSFCCYLNQQSEARYFNMNQKDRQNVNRILFVPSNIISSFGDFTQAQQILEQEFLEYEDLSYKLYRIYRYVGFIINKNQNHWQFVYIDFQKKIIYEFDSLGGNVSNKILQILIDFFKLSQKFQLKKSEQIRQNDSYSCGLHVANFMKYLQVKQFDNQIQLQYSEKEIKTILLTLIKE